MSISREQFSLKKIKLIAGGGIETDFHTTLQDGNEENILSNYLKSPVLEHPTLTKLVDSLEDIFIVEMGMNPAKNKKNETYLKDRVSITGVSIKLEEEAVKAVITAKFRCTRENVVAMNTPNLHWEDSHEIFDLLTELEDETYQYIFNGKKAQLELFNQEGKGIGADTEVPTETKPMEAVG